MSLWLFGDNCELTHAFHNMHSFCNLKKGSSLSLLCGLSSATMTAYNMNRKGWNFVLEIKF